MKEQKVLISEIKTGLQAIASCGLSVDEVILSRSQAIIKIKNIDHEEKPELNGKPKSWD